MKKIFIIIICKLFFIFNIWFVDANVWDIGHWRDSSWGQIPGTTFWWFNFDSEIRNDGIYTKPNDSTIEITEAGDYLIIATTHDEDTSNGRYNSQLTISQTVGTGNIFSSNYTWFSRDNSENESWTRWVGIVIGATANSEFQVQKRRDTDAPTGWSVINSSDLQIVKLHQSNYWIYDIGGTGNVYWWTTPNTVDITNISSESNTASIEWNTTSETITIKWDNKTYIVAWSASFDSGNTRTQRIWHLEYDSMDSLSTRSYCYNRNSSNEYCWLGSMDIIRTSTTDIDLQTEIYRWDWVLADQGWADVDWNLATDGNGQIIVLEMPDYLEVFSSEDSVGLQDITTAQTLNIARDTNITDTGSFTKASDTTVNVTDPSDILSWANVWTARSNVSAWQRQTSYGSIVIDGIEQTIWRHGNYSRWNQSSTDTFAMWFHPAGIFTTSWTGATLWVNSDPLAWWEAGWNDRTQAWTLGFFAINLDSLVPTPGWVSSNMELWLKADDWTSTTTDWASLTTWDDQSWNGYDAWGWVSPTYYSTTTDLNFNPVVDFNGTTQYLENLANWVSTDSYFAVVIPDSQVDWTLWWQVPYAFDCDDANTNTWLCWLTFWWLVLWAFTAAINDEVITHAIWASTDWRSAQIWTASYPVSKPMLININENSAGTWTEISEKWLKIDNYTANTHQVLWWTDYRLWMSTDAANPFEYDWKIAEIINYGSRTSPADKQKIESYLSLKYWMTQNSWLINYIASDWSTNMWDTTTAWTYINDIFWIWRDDLSELWQIKSKSVNNDSIITIEAVSEWTNASPTFVDIANNEFLTISNDGWWNTWTATDTPAWYNLLTRKWRVQEIWEVWTVDLDFDVGNTNFDVPATSSWTTYYYIYDSDNDNNFSDETPQAMTNTSWSIWQIAGTDIDHSREFTIATEASTNNIPTDIALSNNSINENVVADSTIWTLTSTDADLLDTHTYSLVAWTWDDDNQYFTITWSTLKLIHSPDYEIKQSYDIRIETDDWNGWTYQEAFTININNLWETIPSQLGFEDSLDDYKYNVNSWDWSRTTTNAYTWTYSLESDNLWLNNTQSCFEVNNMLSQTGTISFYYNVSSQGWSDFLRFYVDNVEQQAWSGTIWWTQYTKTDVAAWSRTYKWCYIKDNWWSAWTDNAFIDFVATQPTTAWDIIDPVISSINYASWSLLPWWNHDIIIWYTDADSWIDTTSDVISLNKWNWTIWWADISATGFDLWSKTVTVTTATYPTDNLVFWKYRYNFSIDDNNANTASTWAVFYIDQPEFIISTWSIDIWDLENWITKFSTWMSVTVKTVWAWFDVILNKSWALSEWTIDIIDWNTTEWVWYDKDPYTSTISLINTNEIIATQTWSINIDGNKNTYIYNIKFWALIWPEQAAWDYEWLIKFWLDLDY
jgi:hypothetical protein